MANRTPTSDTDQTRPLAARPRAGDGADPSPAGTPGAVGVPAATDVPPGQVSVGSGAAGAGRPRNELGRFVATPTIPPMSAGLAQALLDADAEAWRVDNATRTAHVLVAAVAFDDLVRHGGVS